MREKVLKCFLSEGVVKIAKEHAEVWLLEKLKGEFPT